MEDAFISYAREIRRRAELSPRRWGARAFPSGGTSGEQETDKQKSGSYFSYIVVFYIDDTL